MRCGLVKYTAGNDTNLNISLSNKEKKKNRISSTRQGARYERSECERSEQRLTTANKDYDGWTNLRYSEISEHKPSCDSGKIVFPLWHILALHLAAYGGCGTAAAVCGGSQGDPPESLGGR